MSSPQHEGLEWADPPNAPHILTARLLIEQAFLLAGTEDAQVYTRYTRSLKEGSMEGSLTRTENSEDSSQEITLHGPEKSVVGEAPIMKLSMLRSKGGYALSAEVGYVMGVDASNAKVMITDFIEALRYWEDATIEDREIAEYINGLLNCDPEDLEECMGLIAEDLWRTAERSIKDHTRTYVVTECYEGHDGGLLINVHATRATTISDVGEIGEPKRYVTASYTNPQTGTTHSIHSENIEQLEYEISTRSEHPDAEDDDSVISPADQDKVRMFNDMFAELMADRLGKLNFDSLDLYSSCLADEIERSMQKKERSARLGSMLWLVKEAFSKKFEAEYMVVNLERTYRPPQDGSPHVYNAISRNAQDSFNKVYLDADYLLNLDGEDLRTLDPGTLRNVMYLGTRVLSMWNNPEEKQDEDEDADDDFDLEVESGIYIRGLYLEIGDRYILSCQEALFPYKKAIRYQGGFN